MAKRTPIRFETVTLEDGSTKDFPVYLLTCAESGVEFEHVQRGRGRPPVYCPEVRERRETEKPERAPGVRRGPRPAILRAEVSEDTPEPGDIVVRLTHGMKRPNALNWVTPVRLLSVDGDTATVDRNGEHLTTRFSNLVKLVTQ